MNICWIEQAGNAKNTVSSAAAPVLAQRPSRHQAKATKPNAGFYVLGQLTHPAQLMAAYHQLGEQMNDAEPYVTVQLVVIDGRSRTVVRLLSTRTYSDIVGAEEVIEAIIRCQQALHAQQACHHQPAKRSLAVMVQPTAAPSATV